MTPRIVARNLRRKITRSVKGPKPEETKAAGSGDSASVTATKPSGETKAAGLGDSASATGTKPNGSAELSIEEVENYVVIAGLVAVIGGLGWYNFSEYKKYFK